MTTLLSLWILVRFFACLIISFQYFLGSRVGISCGVQENSVVRFFLFAFALGFAFALDFGFGTAFASGFNSSDSALGVTSVSFPLFLDSSRQNSLLV